ncbi:MAG TPA: GTP-binding protein [Coleofasciculaceae cyanobacterium]|jgi:GTP-binding protein
MKIHTADYVKSAPSLKDCPDFGGLPEIVLVGRSNVGKSSFINSMTRRKNLARTSNTPGKTRYINFYHITYTEEAESGSARTSKLKVSPKASPRMGEETPVHTLVFVDLPGYGYAKISKTEQEQWRRNLEAYLLKREAIRLVIQLIDARHGPQDNDIRMFEWLQHHGKRVQVVLTKSDKLSRNEASKELASTARALDLDASDIIVYSAETYLGRDTAWQVLEPLVNSPTQV